jgi:hypothetical protein
MNSIPDLKIAIDLAKSGNKTEAAKLLSIIVKEQPDNEAAWLWLASCLKTNQQKLYCLHQALALNPDNETTQKAIHKLKDQLAKPLEETDQPSNLQSRPKSMIIAQRKEEKTAGKKRLNLPMIVFFGLISIGLILFLVTPKSERADPPSIEGLYLSNIDTGPLNNRQAYYLLRFFPDGTVMGATVLGVPDQVGDLWSIFIYQHNFTIEHKEDFPFGQYQLGEETPDGKLITFTLEYKYIGHPDYGKRIYTGYINEQETYVSECSENLTPCINRIYQKIQQD